MSIESKFEAWKKSIAGQAKIREKMEEYYRKGVTHTSSGQEILSENRIARAATKFRQCLETAARDAGLPDSVLAHILSMSYTKPIHVGDTWELMFVFGGNLHRDSLDNDLPYDGIDNIVALFNNGYEAGDYVYGWWDNHRPTGWALSRSSTPGEDFAWVRSRKQREPLHFIQQAVNDFNGNYGSELNMTAMAAEVYEK